MKTHHGMMLGELVMTQGVNEKFHNDPAFHVHLQMSFEKYLAHDWGACDKEDAALNDQATTDGTRIIASYPMDEDTTGKIWIITEADRSVTTFLFPSEY